MAQEFIVLEPKNKYGNIQLNRSVFTSIALNAIEEMDDVVLAEANKPFKGGIQTKIEDNHLSLSIPVKLSHKANVTDICASLQTKIFESISYMTEFKPDSIEIQVVGFIF